MQPKLSLGGVRSFIAHVANVAAGVVVGVAAVAVLAALAPTAFAWAAAGTLVLGAAVIGGKLGDIDYHWARGEAGDANLVSTVRSHFDRPAAAEAVAL